MPGEWSQIMKIKTNSRIYYKNQSTAIIPTFSNIIKTTINKFTGTKTKSTSTSQTQSEPTITPKETKPAVKTENKKRCFLWWCW
jgi:hypothetical protein